MAVEGSNGNLIASDKVEGTAVGRTAEPLRWRREQPVQRRRSAAEIEVRNCLS